MTLNLRFEQSPEGEGKSLLPASPLRVYESSFPRFLSFYLSGDEHTVGRGIRLNRKQVNELRDGLEDWLITDSNKDI